MGLYGLRYSLHLHPWEQVFCYMHIIILFSWRVFEKLYYLQTVISKWPCCHRWKLRILIFTPRWWLEKGKPWYRSDWKWGNITSDNFIWGLEHCDYRQPNDNVKGKAVAVHIMEAYRGREGKFQAFISMDGDRSLVFHWPFLKKKKDLLPTIYVFVEPPSPYM